MRGLIRSGWFLAALMLAFPGAVQAKEKTADSASTDVEKAVLAVREDIQRDTTELNGLRKQIAEQRRPLAARLEELQKTVRDRRAEVQRIRLLRRQGEQEQVALEEQAVALEEECRFLQALFSEYARAMETRVSAAEAMRLTDALEPIREELAADEDVEGLARSAGNLLELAALQNRDRLGGFRFRGIALDGNGIEQAGLFAVVGPTAWFAADDKGPAGLAMTQFGSLLPVIHGDLSQSSPEAIRSLTAGEPAAVPVDVTGGDAIRVADAQPTLMEHLKEGGFVMIPLLLVALVAAVLTLWKAVSLGMIHVKSDSRVDAVLDAVRQGDIRKAETEAAGLTLPVRSLVEGAVAHHDAPRENLEEIMHEHVVAELPGLERNLGTLAVLGGIAPLLGLLGTVTGMIHTFQLVTIFGSGDAKLLSGGISEALVTTETGLAIAIPVLLAHAFLARRAKSIIGALEQLAMRMVNQLKDGRGAA